MKSLTPTYCLSILLFCFLSSSVFSQTWETLNASTLSWRFEDLYFVDEDKGWVVDGAGQVLHTADGGENWTQQYFNSDYYFRSVEFYNDQIGFAGTLANGNPSASLLKTIDGGQTWVDITNSLPNNVPGICGISMVDENTIYITGVFFGSAYVMKSTDQGQSWSYASLASLCNGLVDIHFVDENNGFAVGQSAQGTGLRAIIIGTTDGGDTWNELAIADHVNQRAWKIQMLNEIVFYASIEEFEPSPQYFKSVDGGQSWGLQTVETTNTSGTMQGIGFLNEDLGWIGGFGELFYETQDAGQTWEYLPTIGQSFNRFYRVNNTLMFGSGVNVYRYSDPTLGVEDFTIPKPKGHTITVMGSNPVEHQTEISLELVNNTYYELSVYNGSGQRIQTIYEGLGEKGTYSIPWNTKGLAAGNYFLALYTYYGYQSIKAQVK
ncbi:YCF48-related protein [Aureisphaera galaxeae]|uniref:YCF48-related protein n=1 Tax=Aureisphaera galaxeae TaxID=1538023 RepID=UPI00234FE02E|nr:YCF48-related protein [Aureisphaera galaxeae]MDC8002552.1 YCF48-related protein [Aureisphaera galaxeae]